jgi:uncharacterized membrane protein
MLPNACISRASVHIEGGSSMRWITYVLVVAAIGGCNSDAPIAPSAVSLSRRPQPVRYTVTELSSPLDGSGRGTNINDHGLVTGFSSAPDNSARHAIVWRNGSATDLRTFGGAYSTVAWPGLSENGIVVGLSETADVNRFNESWSCSAFFPTTTKHNCLGFVYEYGRVRRLPTLGGDNGFASGVNARGEIVGWAETKVHDPTCVSPQVLQFRAVMWEPGGRRPHELRPLRGDSTSAATAINARGQVVGISGKCDVAVGEFSAQHAVIWDDGRPEKLPTFGGKAWNTPVDINDAGDVTGFSDFPGDDDGTSNFQGFIWSKRAGIKKLGVLPGDEISQPFAINASRQIVGVSCGEVACHPFIWENDVMQDVNALMAPGLHGNILSARDINDDGAITGDMFDSTTSKNVAFVATPTHDHR